MNNFDRAEKACYDRLKRAKKDTKTDREIELEKKLEIAVKALKCYAFECFEAEEIEYDELSPNYGMPVIKEFPYAVDPELAQQTLKEIEG